MFFKKDNFYIKNVFYQGSEFLSQTQKKKSKPLNVMLKTLDISKKCLFH